MSLRPSLLCLLLAAATFGQSPFEPSRTPVAPAKTEASEGRLAALKDHPELKEQLEKLKAMSPQDRRAWLKEHPEAAEKIKQAMGGLRAKAGGEADSPAKDRLAEFAKDHPDLKEQIEKLKAMSAEDRQAWLKEHPEAAEKLEKAKGALRERAQNLTPEQQEQLKARMKERLEKLSPEERAELLKKHPELKEKLGEAAK
jgi:2-oxo-4-hydroxy-4-carboxy--5-ureidoimidazoline (OHCU) decarboxylase